MEALYKFNVSFRRSGYLSGIFIAKKEDVDNLIKYRTSVWFGEVLGKHSEIVLDMEDDMFTMLTDEQEVLNIVKKYNLESGYNPFDYIEDVEDLLED